MAASAHHADVSRSWVPSVLGVLLLVNVGFLAINLVSFALFGRVLKFFYLDEEGNLPTWWSCVQLLLAGLLLGLMVVRNILVRPALVVLGLLALCLIAMSIDEMSEVHERVGVYLDRIVGDRSGTRFHHTGLWFAVIGVPFAIVVVLLLRRVSAFLAEVPGTRLRLLLGFAVLLAGAIGVEALSNFVIDEEMLEDRAQVGSYVFLAVLEEFLEMSGGSLLLWASLGLVRNHWSTRGLVDHLRPLTRHEAAARGGL